MKAKAKAKGGARGPGRGVAALRRPAGADTRGEGRGDHLASWEAGHTLRGAELTVDWALKAQHLVVEEAQYFHKACKVAGEVLGAGCTTLSKCCPHLGARMSRSFLLSASVCWLLGRLGSVKLDEEG